MSHTKLPKGQLSMKPSMLMHYVCGNVSSSAHGEADRY